MFCKRKSFQAISMALLAFLLLLPIAGCKNGGAQQGAKEKVLTICCPDDIGDLDPHTYNSEMFAQAFVYENLLKYGDNGKIEPKLAESWSISPDGKEYTFKLRHGVKFSDGSDFNAAVVKKNYDAVLKARKNHEWLELINQIADTQAVDDYTFKIAFKNPYYPALQELTLIRPMCFLALAGFPDGGDTSQTIKKPVGTGPWVLSEYKKSEYAVFTRNPYYWGVKPKPDKVVVKVIPDGETATIAFEKNEVDLLYGTGIISLDSFKQLRDSGKYQTLISKPLTTRVIGLNSNRGPTKELPVRLALQYGFNKQAVIDGVFYGTETRADTLFATGFPYCNLNLQPRTYNLDKARQLLDDAGWKQPQGKEFREKDGQALELNLCFDSSDNVQKGIAEIAQDDLKKIGVKIELVGEESQSYYKRQKDGTFNMILGETWGAPYDPHSSVSSMRAPSHMDYQVQSGLPMKKEIDQKIEQVLLSTDEASRQKLYADILGTLHDQAVYLPISYTTNKVVFHKNVTGVTFETKNEIPLTGVDIT